jgi:uncharacterized membrane protein HdeD (DUF308 family)
VAQEVVMSGTVHTTQARSDHAPGRWTPLLFGLAGALAAPVVGVALRGVRALTGPAGSVPSLSPGMLGVVAAIGLAAAGLVLGVRALRRGVRGGAAWSGTVLSGLVLLLWGLFAVAEVAFPH